MNSIGERLKAARMARGLTQEKLAAGIATKGFISQVESNRTRPSLARLRLLADRLGLPLTYFLETEAPGDSVYLLKAAELAIRAHEHKRALKLLDEIAIDELGASERADVGRLRGMALREAGRPTPALRELHAAASLVPGDDPGLSAAIYAEIGAVLGDGEQFSASAEASLRSLRWLDRARRPDLDLKARVLTNLATDYFRLGKVEQAIAYLNQALDVATNAESLLRLANAHMSMGITARAAGELDQAIRHCDQALALHRRLGQERIANQILNNLGDAHFARGNLEEARRLQQQCLERGRQLHEFTAVAAAAAELSRYALSAGHPSAALAYAAEAQLAAERSGNHVFHARAVALEGMAAERQGRRKDADRLFRLAFTELLVRDARAELAETCARYSDLLRKRGNAQDALRYMAMAYARDFSGLDSSRQSR